MSKSLISRLQLALVLTVLALMSWDISRMFVVDASMEHFLPESNERELYRISRRVIESTLTKRMILTVAYPKTSTSAPHQQGTSTNSLQSHLDITRQLKTRLQAIEGISKVVSGPPQGMDVTFFDLYFPRRFSFYSFTPEKDAPLLFGDSGLRRSAQELKERLGGPEGMFLRNLAPRDPWLLFPNFLDELQSEAFSLDIIDGQFFSKAHKQSTTPSDAVSVLFIDLADSALDSKAQGPLLIEFEKAIRELHISNPGNWVVESSGANRFAVATEKSMKADIQRVFAYSTGGLLLLFVLLFRTLRRLLFLVLPIVAGLVIATWCSLSVYGNLHALTLAFGGSLIGVALDYPVHVLCHHGLDTPGRSPRMALSHLRPTLLLASGTTIVGLMGLAWTAFPGIREIALFTSTGVAGALLTTFVAAPLLGVSGRAPTLAKKLSVFLNAHYGRLAGNKRILAGIFIAALSLSAWGLTMSRFAPGLESLAPLDPQLMAEDLRVRNAVGANDGGKLIVSLAPQLEDALVTNEEVAQAMIQAKSDGIIGGSKSVSHLLRSKSLQQRALHALPPPSDLATRTQEALGHAGFVSEAFSQLENELSRPPLLLDWQTLQQTPLADILSPFIFQSSDEFAVITSLQEIQDERILRSRIDSIKNAHYFSQRAVLNHAYNDLRSRTAQLLAAGLLLVCAAAWVRYRNWKLAAVAIVPALLAACATLGLLALLGEKLNLLHLLGLLLACSMGVDYGVFLADCRTDKIGPALLSIVIGCISTLFAFGALALSSAPALHALGLSIGIGVFFSLLLAPATLILLSPNSMNFSRAK